MKKNISFKNKLILSYIVVGLLPMLVLGTYSYIQSNNLIEQKVLQEIQNGITQKCEYIEYELMRIEDMANEMSYNVSVQQILKGGHKSNLYLYYDLSDFFDPYINSFLYNNRRVNRISFYISRDLTEHGTSILNSQRVSGEQWYMNALNSVGVNWGYSNGNLILSTRVQDLSDDKILAVLYIEVNVDSVFSAIFSSDESNVNYFVYNTENQLIFPLAHRNFYIDDLTSVKPNEKNKIYGNNYLAVADDIKGSTYQVYGFFPVKEADKGTGNILLFTLYAVIICTVMLLFLVNGFSNFFVGRITHLTCLMACVENGNFDIDIKSDENDEIGMLTNRFGLLLQKVNSLIRDVYQATNEKQQEELKTLQAQINPHFLYNSLSAIKWKAIQNEDAEVSDLIEMLAEFYRATLNKSNGISTIKDEITNISQYIKIQLVTHENNFDVEYDIDENVYKYRSPNFILQPIVENAIFHGIGDKTNGRGKIRIEAYVRDKIYINVIDNGGGGTEKNLNDIFNVENSGHGMKNVLKRIRLMYGEDYGITFKSSKTGTTVSIVLPKSYIDADEKNDVIQ